jgi:thioredoxin reductase (NADPH)
MSTYLVDRITAAPNITVRCATQVVAADGDTHLERLTLAGRTSDEHEEVEASWLFVFIGASPRTDWLGGSVARDGHGFVLTGPEVVTSDATWGLARAPYALETSLPGVFAAGDVRLESMKRVASAVGEGAISVYLVHRYLETV